jgi:lactate racemase
MSAAHQVIRPGGTIICAAECHDGFPDHGSYRSTLVAAESSQALLDQIAASPATTPDPWQLQIQAGIQAASRVILHTSYLTDAELRAAHLDQTADISSTISESLATSGPDACL